MISSGLKETFRTRSSRYYGMLKVFRDLILFDQSYLHTSGYYKSASKLDPCKPDGSPIPWMNYSVVEILEEALNNSTDVKLFEYGSGSSTLFFADRVKTVISCEHDKVWFEKLKTKLPVNAQVMYRAEDKDGKYCRAIADTSEQFDMVVVDGRDRPNCIKQSLDYLTDRGVIVLDDSHREGYQDVLNDLRALGFRILTITGMKPLVKKAHSTSICYRDGNCLGL